MNRTIRTHLLRAAAALLVAAPAAAQTAPNPAEPLPIDPAVKTGTFPNGLRYYIRPNAKPDNKVELRLVVRAGSMQETDEQQGLAHFMEHMNFNGTKNFQKNELVSYLQSIGVEFGADLNAYTSFDETVYILPIPTDKAGNLEKGFQIIEDWAHNALLTDKDIDEERGVVLEESRLGKGADDRMMQRYFPVYASGTKYAERLPIGKDNILKNFKPETIRAYYRDWYRPNLQAVIVVGDIDTATAMRYLRKHFAGLTNPANSPLRTAETVKPRTESVAMVVTDKEATNSVLQLMYPPVPEPRERTVGDYREFLKKQLALSIINQRLQDVAQGAASPFPFAQVYFNNMIQGYENLSAVTLFGTEGPENALKALTAELARARQHGFTQSELDRARADMMAGIEKSYNERTTTDSRAYAEEYIRNFLTDEPIPGIAREREYYKAFLPAITVADLNPLPGQWMKNEAVFTLVTAPEAGDQKLPSEKDLRRMTEEGLKQSVAAVEEKAVTGTLLATMPARGAVREKREDKDLGTTTYTLSNGVMVTVKPTTFKSDEVVLKGIKRGGDATYGQADILDARFATQLVDAMGAGDFTPSDLDRMMTGKVARVSSSIGEVSNSVDGSSSVKDFETLLQLLYLKLTAPRKDEALFAAYKQKQTMMLQFISQNPQAYFADTMVRVLYGGNPLRPMVFPKPADLAAINLDRALEIYRKEVGRADGYHFFIVGNVNKDTAVRLIEQYLGALPGTPAIPYIKDNGVHPLPGKRDITVRRGSEKQSLILTQYYGDIPYSQDMDLRASMLADVLNIRVVEELRERLGSIYGGGFNANVEQFPRGQYSVGMYLPCGPENVDTLLAASDREIQALIARGPSAADLTKVKNQKIEAYRTSVKENGWWANQLMSVLFWGRDKAKLTGYEKWVQGVTAAQLQETARTFFGGPNKFTAVLYPATATATTPGQVETPGVEAPRR